jgi:hypothetical protein
MKPAPMTVTRAVPSAMRSRSATESSSVRSSNTPSRLGCLGSRRGDAPVAMISPS